MLIFTQALTTSIPVNACVGHPNETDKRSPLWEAWFCRGWGLMAGRPREVAKRNERIARLLNDLSATSQLAAAWLMATRIQKTIWQLVHTYPSQG